MKPRHLALLGTGLLYSALAGAASHTPSVVVTWNEAALEEVRRGRLGPPVVARALAVAHTCIYDAWVPYDRRALALVATHIARRPAHERNDANKAKAVSFAAYRCLTNLFPAPAQVARLQAQMQRLGYNPADTSTATHTPQGIGNAAATAVIASRRHDGSNQYGDLAPGAYSDYTGYAPVNAPLPFCLPFTPGSCPLNVSNLLRWQPLVNDAGAVQTFVAPHWGNVQPFALSASTQYDHLPEIADGPRFLNPALYQVDIDEILRYSREITERRKLIVEYWADGPDSELPPGHWSLFAQFVSQRDRHGIDQDVKLFFTMQNASFDAGIVAWHLKRKYDGVRPITGVRFFRRGQTLLAWGGPGRPVETIDGGKWAPYNPGSNLSPAFAGYISGHSTFSAASATALRAYTGSDIFGFVTVVPPNFGRVEPGVPAVPTELRYPTFTAAADDAGISRLYAGIHYTDDNTDGQMLGTLIGQQAWQKAQFLFDGGLVDTNQSFDASVDSPSFSWSHTVEAAANRLLVVGVSTSKKTSISAVRYGGLPLQRLARQGDSADKNAVELWWRVAPPVGTASVTVYQTGKDEVAAGAVTYTGVNQAQPFGTVRAISGKSDTACVTLANEPAPQVATVLVAEGKALQVQPPSGGPLQRWNVLVTKDYGSSSGDDDDDEKGEIIGAGSSGPGAPVATVCQTLGKAKKWAMLGVPLRPAH